MLADLTSLRSMLADANAGKGQWAGLLRNDDTWQQLLSLLKATDAAITSLNAGAGPAGRLLANAQLYESLNGSLRGMEAFLSDFRQNPRKYLRIKPFSHK
jgi:phospholipid/cholesterol/gamma-HCH transport system substrate-binding protein